MKMVMITYNEALEDEIMDFLEKNSIKNYTKMTKVYGRGTASGTHLGNDIWPGLNNILYIACKDDEARHLASGVSDLRKTLGKEGVKAFVMPIDEIT